MDFKPTNNGEKKESLFNWEPDGCRFASPCRQDRPLEGAPVTQEMADIFLGNEKPLSKAQDGIEGVCVTSNIGFETFSLQISICSDVTKINHKTWTFCSRNVCQCC